MGVFLILQLDLNILSYQLSLHNDVLHFDKIMCIQKFTYFVHAERSLNFQDPFCQMLKGASCTYALNTRRDFTSLARDHVGASCEEDARVKFSY